MEKYLVATGTTKKGVKKHIVLKKSWIIETSEGLKIGNLFMSYFHKNLNIKDVDKSAALEEYSRDFTGKNNSCSKFVLQSIHSKLKNISYIS